MPRNAAVLILPTRHYLDYVTCVIRRYVLTKNYFVEVTPLVDGSATTANVRDTITSRDPSLVFGTGHGVGCAYSVECTEVFLAVSSPENPACVDMNLDVVGGRVWYLLSCSTGRELGKSLIDYGARAFLGYAEDFLFPITHSPCGAREVISPFIPDVKALSALLSGSSVGEAVEVREREYDRELSYWVVGLGRGSPDAPLISRILEANRLVAVSYGDVEVRPLTPQVTAVGTAVETLKKLVTAGILIYPFIPVPRRGG